MLGGIIRFCGKTCLGRLYDFAVRRAWGSIYLKENRERNRKWNFSWKEKCNIFYVENYEWLIPCLVRSKQGIHQAGFGKDTWELSHPPTLVWDIFWGQYVL